MFKRPGLVQGGRTPKGIVILPMFNLQKGKSQLLSKSMKGPRLYSLQTEKLAWHSFSDAGRRREIPKSEMKESLLFTAKAVAIVSAFLCQFLEPQHSNSRLCYRRGTKSLGNVNLLQWVRVCLSFALERNIITLDSKYACPLLTRSAVSALLTACEK